MPQIEGCGKVGKSVLWQDQSRLPFPHLSISAREGRYEIP
jgi:hypothetical protein